MITLAGIPLDPNLHLMGFETNGDVSYSVRELLGGPGVIQIEPRSVPAALRLIARNDGSSRMGRYCSYQIDALKIIAGLGKVVPLVHPRGSYNVFILEFPLQQSDEREAPDPNKKWHGDILLQYVDVYTAESVESLPLTSSYDFSKGSNSQYVPTIT